MKTAPTPKQLVVLGLLATAMFREGTFPTDQELADKLKIHKWTVRTHMVALRAHGFVRPNCANGHLGKITTEGWATLFEHGWRAPKRWCAFAHAVRHEVEEKQKQTETPRG